MKQPPSNPDNRCAATKPDGSPCRAAAKHGSRFCVFHDPDPEARARSEEVRVRGGANSARLTRAMKRLPSDLRAVYDRLAQALEEVHAGTLDANRAHAMAALSRAMVTVLDSAETLHRLDSIERLLEDHDPLAALGYEAEEVTRP